MISRKVMVTHPMDVKAAMAKVESTRLKGKIASRVSNALIQVLTKLTGCSTVKISHTNTEALQSVSNSGLIYSGLMKVTASVVDKGYAKSIEIPIEVKNSEFTLPDSKILQNKIASIKVTDRLHDMTVARVASHISRLEANLKATDEYYAGLMPKVANKKVSDIKTVIAEIMAHKFVKKAKVEKKAAKETPALTRAHKRIKEDLSVIDMDQRYDEFLDEVYGDVKVGSYEYSTSRTLKEIDPIAYRVGFDDWSDSEIGVTVYEIAGDYYNYDDAQTIIDEEEAKEDEVETEASKTEPSVEKEAAVTKEAKEIQAPGVGRSFIPDNIMSKTFPISKANAPADLKDGDTYIFGGRTYKVKEAPSDFGQEASTKWLVTLID